MSQLLSALPTKESIGDDNAAVGEVITDGDGAADPLSGPQNSADDHERPKACEEGRQERQCFRGGRHCPREARVLGEKAAISLRNVRGPYHLESGTEKWSRILSCKI